VGTVVATSVLSLLTLSVILTLAGV